MLHSPHTHASHAAPCPSPAHPPPPPPADVLQGGACGVCAGGGGGGHRSLELPLPQHLQPPHSGPVCRQRHRRQGGCPLAWVGGWVGTSAPHTQRKRLHTPTMHAPRRRPAPPHARHVSAFLPSFFQVSEHACWSSVYYKRIIDAALVAAGAPPDLVQVGWRRCSAGGAGCLLGGQPRGGGGQALSGMLAGWLAASGPRPPCPAWPACPPERRLSRCPPPPRCPQIVTGYGEAGNALVTSQTSASSSLWAARRSGAR